MPRRDDGMRLLMNWDTSPGRVLELQQMKNDTVLDIFLVTLPVGQARDLERL